MTHFDSSGAVRLVAPQRLALRLLQKRAARQILTRALPRWTQPCLKQNPLNQTRKRKFPILGARRAASQLQMRSGKGQVLRLMFGLQSSCRPALHALLLGCASIIICRFVSAVSCSPCLHFTPLICFVGFKGSSQTSSITRKNFFFF